MSIFSTSSTPSNSGNFNLYDNNYLQPIAGITSSLPVISFTNLMDFNIEYDSHVAQEPIEEGSYSVDAKQNRATIIKLTASYAPTKGIINNKDQSVNIQFIVKTLQSYKEGINLLTISMENPPMFDIYNNLNLLNFKYDLNPYQTTLFANLTFLVVRFSQSDAGLLPQNQVQQSNYASKVDNGQQNTSNANVNNLTGT